MAGGSVGGSGVVVGIEERSEGGGEVRAVGGVDEGSEEGPGWGVEVEFEMRVENRLEDEAEF